LILIIMNDLARLTPVKRSKPTVPGWVWIAATLVGSLLFGLLVLPRVASHEVRASSLVPNFSLTLLNGDGTENSSRLSLTALRGKVTILDFWATWCGPCAEQAKILERYNSVPRSNVEVIGINAGEPTEVVSKHLRQHPAGYAIALDETSQVGEAFGVRGLPTLIVIAPNGRVSAVTSGVVSYAQLERLVRSAF
jgi:cytochrome c biogenesis protein CcmG, thiol:disulfide interchange protein DsbE